MAKKYVFRKRLLIFPRFQLPLIAVNLAVILTVAAITWVTVQNAIMDLKPVAGLSGIEIDYFKKYLDYQASRLQAAMLISLLFGVAFSAGMTLIVSHRLAGPLVRMRNYFRTISQDESDTIPRLEFRNGDYLSDLPPLINKAISDAHGDSKMEAPRRSA